MPTRAAPPPADQWAWPLFNLRPIQRWHDPPAAPTPAIRLTFASLLGRVMRQQRAPPEARSPTSSSDNNEGRQITCCWRAAGNRLLRMADEQEGRSALPRARPLAQCSLAERSREYRMTTIDEGRARIGPQRDDFIMIVRRQAWRSGGKLSESGWRAGKLFTLAIKCSAELSRSQDQSGNEGEEGRERERGETDTRRS